MCLCDRCPVATTVEGLEPEPRQRAIELILEELGVEAMPARESGALLVHSFVGLSEGNGLVL